MSNLIPSDYAATLRDLKRRVHDARYLAQRQANTAMILLYWDIGAVLAERSASASWGAKVVEQLGKDLSTEFPQTKGFSRRNLLYMRSLAEAWPDRTDFVQRPVAQLPWGHIIDLLTKLNASEDRDWYAQKDIKHGWSRSVLVHQIATRLRDRDEAAPSNFSSALEQADSELAQQITKDPFALGFLAIDSDASERQLEERLVERIIDTLRELGPGFAFVGRQVHFDIDGDDFFVDLLFFHIPQVRYVVIELKTTKFDPRDAGQLGFYVALVDGRLRDIDAHQPTVGMLLVADKNETVVRYALAGTNQPMAVSRFDLSAAVQAALPTEDALSRIAFEAKHVAE
jgi:predicted nuclease of restriction endonuclease-like (RecB) superfamily